MKRENHNPVDVAAWLAVVCIALVLALATWGCNRPDPARVATGVARPPDIGEYAEDAAGVADRVEGGAGEILGHTGTVRRVVRANAAIAAAAEPPLAAIDHEATSLAGESIRLRVLAEQLTETQLQVRRLGEALEAESARANDLAGTLHDERMGWVRTTCAWLGVVGAGCLAAGLIVALGLRSPMGWGFGAAGSAIVAASVALSALATAAAVVIWWLRVGLSVACAGALAYGALLAYQYVRSRRALVSVVRSVDAATAALGASGEPPREALNQALAANQEPDTRAAVAEIRGGAA